MLSSDQIEAHLAGLAEAFQTSFLSTNGSKGWGQFLEAPRQHKQVGQYGTCAGVICLSLAGQHSTPNCQAGVQQLDRWWRARHTDDDARRVFVQTTRMAFQALAIRLSAGNGIPEKGLSVEKELFNRQLPEGGWGAWHISDESHDPTPRPFPTAIVVLALLLFRGAQLDDDGRTAIQSAVRFLGTRLRSSQPLSIVEKAAVVAAAKAGEVFAENVQASDRDKVRIPRRFWSRAGESPYGHYFFHYQYPVGRRSLAYKQDYLFVPPELLVGIAGFLKRSNASLRLAAERLLRKIRTELDASQGLYRIDQAAPPSTIDQAWLAIFFALGGEVAASKAPVAGWSARGWYSLTRERRDNIITATIAPSTALLLVTVADAAAGNLALSIAEGSTVAVSTVIVAGLYGPKVLQKLVRVER